jgi:hypothetical protein
LDEPVDLKLSRLEEFAGEVSFIDELCPGLDDVQRDEKMPDQPDTGCEGEEKERLNGQ